MGEFLALALVEGFFNLVLGSIGAVIRWVIFRGKKPFKEVFVDDDFQNGLIGLLFVVSVMLAIIYI